MAGVYLFGTREGSHPSLICSARADENGKRFLVNRLDFWRLQAQGFEKLVVLHIHSNGWTRVVGEGEIQTWR